MKGKKMTRDEAIEILESVSFFAPSDIDVDTAIDMAIEALKAQQDKIDCKHCVYMNPQTCDCNNFICEKYNRRAK